MKNRLINALFEQFEQDKDIIARNLMEIKNYIVLETKDEYGTLRMIIEYERNDNNGEKTINN